MEPTIEDDIFSGVFITNEHTKDGFNMDDFESRGKSHSTSENDIFVWNDESMRGRTLQDFSGESMTVKLQHCSFSVSYTFQRLLTFIVLISDMIYPLTVDD